MGHFVGDEEHLDQSLMPEDHMEGLDFKRVQPWRDVASRRPNSNCSGIASVELWPALQATLNAQMQSHARY